jgi:hypothetical protein
MAAKAESTEIVDARGRPANGSGAMTVFGTDQPKEVMRRTAEVAGELKDFVRQQGLSVQIGDGEHFRVEAWQVVGMMLGVTAILTETKKTGDKGWEAWAELHDRTGRKIGAGDGQCLRDEPRWRAAADHAVRSMAQTRAIGRAFRNTFGFIAKAAGYEATPAEDYEDGDGAQASTVSQPKRQTAPKAKGEKPKGGEGGGAVASAAQRKLIFARFKEQGSGEENELKAILQWVTGTPHTDKVPKAKVDDVLEAIKDAEGTLSAIRDAAEDADRPDGPDAREIADTFLRNQGEQQSL